ncbi:MAG TPA: S41 family peptidase [bacterium]|nr:S41 family peptidase [bacterium]HPN44218.1 S41 family peptidase [bacterium]
MMNSKKFKRTLWILVAIIAAGIGVSKFNQTQLYSSDSIRDQLVRFNEVFAYINQYYVEKPDNEELITGAIEGMLGGLDPHSVYIPKKAVEQVNEQFEGSFEGIGIEFVVLEKILTVVAPIVGGPSEAVGILPGDQIIKIEGKSAYGITEDEVQKKLRGPKGSKVQVTIRRPEQDNAEFEVTIVRDEIPIYSVTASFMMDDGETGYIYLGRFAKKTSEELEQAMVDLEKQGMKRMILDLRGNSGGYLDQAVEVSDKFLPGGQKIVYTRGRVSNSGSDFYSTDKGTHPIYPLIVMIDHGSASASEIVAGAIQDLDRGLVVGQTSFGKGLVQNQIPLRDGSALRLTIARYYTPSGRLIQRPYDDGIIDYYTEAYDDSSITSKVDSSKQYNTLSGRVVYGGGGITPDITLEAEKITRFTYQLRTKRVFFEYGSKYANTYKKWKKDFQGYKNNFEITQPMLNDLKEIIQKHDVKINQEAFNKDLDYIKLSMKSEMARHIWDSEHYYMIRIMADSEVIKACEHFPKAKEIAMLNKWETRL